MNSDKAGPTEYTMPKQKILVCRGCKYLRVAAGVRGHRIHKNHYGCLHPKFKDEVALLGVVEGRTIHFNHSGECTTPSWCPVMAEKKE